MPTVIPMMSLDLDRGLGQTRAPVAAAATAAANQGAATQEVVLTLAANQIQTLRSRKRRTNRKTKLSRSMGQR